VNSNWTGRFDRVSSNRHIPFEDQHTGDKIVGYAATFFAGFLTALILFGAV